MTLANEHINVILSQYKTIMEEAYNLRQTDPAISDYDFFEGLKLRKNLESKHNIHFRTPTTDLLD